MFAGRRGGSAPDTSAVVVAAGSAARMEGIDKQFALIGDIPVLIRSLMAIESCPSIGEVIVVTREESIPLLHQLLSGYPVNKVRTIVTGGETRQQSVLKGFGQTGGQSRFVAIHDGARPLVWPADIEACIAAARQTGAAALGVPVKETIKQVDGQGRIVRTPDRGSLYAAQTPQVFSKAAYGAAVEKALAAGMEFTDDCQLMEFAGLPVQMVKGSYDNIKITTPEDLAVAAGLLDYRCEWGEGLK
ncbi:MAG: 2-C-methyl-D-erythritol 4-phosphate cytidylyltransferase [Oscillospiraceae bacterium]|nr:2-C-methyl-D-erythritol 4-phosphate cytidylyltransferase [Oscillospiraceae bacterium]